MAAGIQVDETSCGPLCQHPQCWASNNRVERGLPRLDVFQEKKKDFEDGCLPTLKIQNMLDDYGLSSADDYPSVHHIAISSLGANHFNGHIRRSASAPSNTAAGESVLPQTPHQSAESGTRGETSQRGRNRSRLALLEPMKDLYLPRLTKVHLNQLCGPVNPSNEIYMVSQVYVWQPSDKAVQKRKEIMLAKENQSSEPRIISTKDLTETLLPSGISEQRQSKKKMKNKRSKQTPTGGRPYTHPSKTPPAMTRRTLPADMDEGITQLLSLPRDVLLEILENTKESDLFDKEKVQALLAKVMPHIHFDASLNLTALDRGIGSPPPLHAMGLLRNQRMPILEGKLKFEKPDTLLQNKVATLPLLLDDAVMLASSLSCQGRVDGERDQQQVEDRRSLMPAATTVSEGLSHRKNHFDMGHHLPGKITSVSAKILPPLEPGARGTKPFNYNTQSLDLALAPLPTPVSHTLEGPSTPQSGKVSTLFVEVPLEHSVDCIITPVTTAKHPHLAMLRPESLYTRSITSSHPSDEFNRSRQALSSSYSTHVPKAPYGTPATAPQAIFRENTQPSAKTSTSYDNRVLEDVVEKTSKKSSCSSRMRTSSAEQGLHTIHEYVVEDQDASTPDTVAAHPVSDRSPAINPPRSVSPWETAGDKLPIGKTPAPMVHSSTTPTSSTTSLDEWPVVDERSYLHTPEAAIVHSKKMYIPETVAPPPSPEPRVMSTEPRGEAASRVESSDGEELKCTGISLSHLPEEEEEEISTEELMIQYLMEEEKNAAPEFGIVTTSNTRYIKSAVQENEAVTHSLDMMGKNKIEENGGSDFKNIHKALNIHKLEINEK